VWGLASHLQLGDRKYLLKSGHALKPRRPDSLRGVKALAFDAYGTLFDVFSVTALCEQLFPGTGEAQKGISIGLEGVWQMTEKTVINIDDAPLMDPGNGKQFAVKWGRVGPLVGLNGLGCAVARRTARQEGAPLPSASRHGRVVLRRVWRRRIANVDQVGTLSAVMSTDERIATRQKTNSSAPSVA
jgi:hypothetical protein